MRFGGIIQPPPSAPALLDDSRRHHPSAARPRSQVMRFGGIIQPPPSGPALLDDSRRHHPSAARPRSQVMRFGGIIQPPPSGPALLDDSRRHHPDPPARAPEPCGQACRCHIARRSPCPLMPDHCVRRRDRCRRMASPVTMASGDGRSMPPNGITCDHGVLRRAIDAAGGIRTVGVGAGRVEPAGP